MAKWLKGPVWSKIPNSHCNVFGKDKKLTLAFWRHRGHQSQVCSSLSITPWIAQRLNMNWLRTHDYQHLPPKKLKHGYELLIQPSLSLMNTGNKVYLGGYLVRGNSIEINTWMWVKHLTFHRLTNTSARLKTSLKNILPFHSFSILKMKTYTRDMAHFRNIHKTAPSNTSNFISNAGGSYLILSAEAMRVVPKFSIKAPHSKRRVIYFPLREQYKGTLFTPLWLCYF